MVEETLSPQRVCDHDVHNLIEDMVIQGTKEMKNINDADLLREVKVKLPLP